MGDEALDAERGALTHWFRESDKTSELVGTRQASTFQTLAALAGHGELPAARTGSSKKTTAAPRTATKKGTSKGSTPKQDDVKVAAHQATSDVAVGDGRRQSRHDIGLTVRIEVNLPPDGDADTYDAIFCKHQEAPDVVSSPLDRFEAIARSVGAEQAKALAGALTTELPEPEEPHPFETRNIHPDLPNKVRKLFDDGHWEQSVFEAFKYIETEVKRISALRGNTGYVLMMDVFNESNPKVQLNALVTESEIDEQRGYRYIFAGASAGIRNPRGHEVDIGDTPDEALDYLALASLLLRKLDAAGVR